jgi:hypothetical protein
VIQNAGIRDRKGLRIFVLALRDSRNVTHGTLKPLLFTRKKQKYFQNEKYSCYVLPKCDDLTNQWKRWENEQR